MAVQYQVSGHHVKVTPALEGYAVEKLSKLEQRFQHITKVNVILKVENHDQQAEAQVNLAGGRGTLFAKSTSEDMYKSIDSLTDKLLVQITKYHDKLKDHDED